MELTDDRRGRPRSTWIHGVRQQHQGRSHANQPIRHKPRDNSSLAVDAHTAGCSVTIVVAEPPAPPPAAIAAKLQVRG